MEKETLPETAAPVKNRPYKKCLWEKCTNDISDGRPDRKFCGDGCRNLYNNKIKVDDLKEIRNINIALRKNRRILKKLLDNIDGVIVSEKKLRNEGFNFDFSTHTIISKKKNNQFIFSYNYGYTALDNGKYKIVKSFYKDAMPE